MIERLSFHCIVVVKSEVKYSIPSATPISPEETELETLITCASERVWNVFYMHKKEAIEEVFGIQSSFISYEAIPAISSAGGRPAGLDLSNAKYECLLSFAS